MSKFYQTLRTRPDVLPVFVITCIGASFAAVATVRACLQYTDVSFRRKSNPHPWIHVKPDQQTKFIHAYDYGKLKNERPNIDE